MKGSALETKRCALVAHGMSKPENLTLGFILASFLGMRLPQAVALPIHTCSARLWLNAGHPRLILDISQKFCNDDRNQQALAIFIDMRF